MNLVKKMFSGIGSYFAGVVYQAKKVRWPNRELLVKTSALVICFGAFFAIYLNFCNIIIIWMFRALGMSF